MSSFLQVRKVKKSYKSGTRVLDVLKGLDFDIKKGEAAAIIGASGAGKSTLLHLLGALDKPSSGKICLDGVDYSSISGDALAKIRNRRIGFIYQFHHLLPEFSALENIMIPGMMQIEELNPVRNISSYIFSLMHPTLNLGILKELRGRAEGILDDVGLGARLSHRPAKLSGGEQQRVALARALINDPDLVLADEPTGNLDLATGEMVLDVILKRTLGKGKTLILVTHNPDIASRLEVTYHLKSGLLQKE